MMICSEEKERLEEWIGCVFRAIRVGLPKNLTLVFISFFLSKYWKEVRKQTTQVPEEEHFGSGKSRCKGREAGVHQVCREKQQGVNELGLSERQRGTRAWKASWAIVRTWTFILREMGSL